MEKTATDDMSQRDTAAGVDMPVITDDLGTPDSDPPGEDSGDVTPPEFQTLTADVVTAATEATTESVTSSDPVFLWVVSFSATGRPNPPEVGGFDVIDVQVAGNRRQLVLLRADSVDGPVDISFGAQPQDAILWSMVSSSHGALGEPSSFQSQGNAASVPIIGADSPSTGALGGFIVGGMVAATADAGTLGGSACGAGACLLTVTAPGPANGVGMSWTGEAPWIGTGVAVSR